MKAHTGFDNLTAVLLGAFAKLRKATISFVLSVRLSAWNSSAPTGRNFMTYVWALFRKPVEKIQISLKSDKNNWYFTADVSTFMTVSRWILLRVRNISDKTCTEYENTRSSYSVPPPPENGAVYAIMINVVEPERPQLTIRRMCFAWWVRLHARTQKYIIVLICLPR